MIQLDIRNPFPGATAFMMPETESTMTEAKRLANGEFVSGSVIMTDFQTNGRGRIPGRTWESSPGENLLCTILIKHTLAEIPAFPLKVGLACARAIDIIKIERGIAVFDASAQVKWPNDILLGGKKTAGILCESQDGVLFAGIGINVNQTEFPSDVAARATSLKQTYHAEIDRMRLLELVLDTLAFTLVDPDWKTQLVSRLWKRGQLVSFRAGAVDSKTLVHGTIAGIADDGQILLLHDDGIAPVPYAAGEILKD